MRAEEGGGRAEDGAPGVETTVTADASLVPPAAS
jgi:hypothetical protein